MRCLNLGLDSGSTEEGRTDGPPFAASCQKWRRRGHPARTCLASHGRRAGSRRPHAQVPPPPTHPTLTKSLPASYWVSKLGNPSTQETSLCSGHCKRLFRSEKREEDDTVCTCEGGGVISQRREGGGAKMDHHHKRPVSRQELNLRIELHTQLAGGSRTG